MKNKTYTTFKTICSKCDISLKTHKFNVSMGAHSFQLCPKHIEELIRNTSKWLKWSLED